MNEFFQQRLRLHQKTMQRYLKYVFNDHFALTMTFLVGGLGLYYSNTLKTLPKGFTWGTVIVLGVWLIALHIGQFASLAKPADAVFLLPKEKQMRGYLTQAFKYSCYLPFGVLVLIGGATMPLVVLATGMAFSTFAFFLLTLWGLKFSQLQIQRMDLFQDMEKATKNAYLLWWMISLATLSVGLFIYPLIGMLLSFLQMYLFHNLCWQKMQAPLDWDKMIATEQHRLYRLYRFINLFTDVPEITAQIKRRKYMDGFLGNIKFMQKNTYLYLYARRFVRGTEFSGLYLRLLALGSILLVFIVERWFALGIGALFIYLIGFQLLPLYHQFQYMTSVQLYPVSEKQKLRAIQTLLRIALLAVAMIFSVISSVVIATWADRAIVTGGFFIVAILFVELYVPYRLNKGIR